MPTLTPDSQAPWPPYQVTYRRSAQPPQWQRFPLGVPNNHHQPRYIHTYLLSTLDAPDEPIIARPCMTHTRSTERQTADPKQRFALKYISSIVLRPPSPLPPLPRPSRSGSCCRSINAMNTSHQPQLSPSSSTDALSQQPMKRRAAQASRLARTQVAGERHILPKTTASSSVLTLEAAGRNSIAPTQRRQAT